MKQVMWAVVQDGKVIRVLPTRSQARGWTFLARDRSVRKCEVRILKGKS